MSENKKVRTRFAPSPTGFLHIGGARTALFNWLYSRRQGGTFILRVEDTDQARSTEESTRAILEAMTWLGLDWDENPYFQAERVDIHRQMVQKLLLSGKAFCCDCAPEDLEKRRQEALAHGRKPKYDGRCRERGLARGAGVAVRFRCPDQGVTVVPDLIKGHVSFNNEELDDLVIERADGYPTYNFAVVVDDALMEITHVIRGDDHLNNTPRQILLYEALGYQVPLFGHVPMILGADKARLSKRHGATSVMAYKEMGYLPEALVNYLVRLGWSHGDQEIFRREELIELFTLESVGKAAAIFNPEKLLWLNQQYLKIAENGRLADEMEPFWKKRGLNPRSREFALGVVSDLKTRVKTLEELADAGTFYFLDDLVYEEKAAAEYLNKEAAEVLTVVAKRLPPQRDFSREAIESFLRDLATERGVKLKTIMPPLRVALTGKTVSPGIDEIVATLGREEVVRRIEKAIGYINRQRVSLSS
ncbi:MAG: glutamate--tRNA ligase [Smithellaceae bacterium]|nr:glutamate--tRNA ligase [Smithellaceae bacterium]